MKIEKFIPKNIQFMQASPVSSAVPSVPSDLTINHRIMATITSTAIESIATCFPALTDTHSWYSGIAPLIGVSAHYPLISWYIYTILVC